jgi:hypothetical protein
MSVPHLRKQSRHTLPRHQAEPARAARLRCTSPARESSPKRAPAEQMPVAKIEHRHSVDSPKSISRVDGDHRDRSSRAGFRKQATANASEVTTKRASGRPNSLDLTAAAGIGLLAGAIQAVPLVGYLTESSQPSDGFDALGPVVAWLLVLVVLSLVVVTVGLAKLSIRWYGLLTLPVIFIQFSVGLSIGSQASNAAGVSNESQASNTFLALAIMGVLIIEFVLCRLFLGRPPAEPSGPTLRDWS